MIYKAWLMHSLFSLFKLYNYLAGTTNWYDLPKPPCSDFDQEKDGYTAIQAEEEGLCIPFSYNVELTEKIHPPIRDTVPFLIICYLILDLLICKWRSLVHLCIVFELIHSVINYVIVDEYMSYTETNLL